MECFYTPENLERAILDIKNNLNILLELNVITEENIEATLNNLEFFTDLESAVKDADAAITSTFGARYPFVGR